jgi:hypothetical protein
MLEFMPKTKYGNETHLFAKVFFVAKMREYRIKAFGKSLPERFFRFKRICQNHKILIEGGLPA